MKCPECGHNESCVLETRSRFDDRIILRRRKCLVCKYRFRTLEKIDALCVMVKKKDSTCEPFDPEKIKTGVSLACSKRPVTINQIDNIVEEIETNIHNRGVNVIDSKELGEMVVRLLKKTDAVAYLRYISVYRDFDNIEHFENELDNLKSD